MSWTVQRIRADYGANWLATSPGCPTDRHPTRWCDCRVFRTEAKARAYVFAQEAPRRGAKARFEAPEVLSGWCSDGLCDHCPGALAGAPCCCSCHKSGGSR